MKQIVEHIKQGPMVIVLMHGLNNNLRVMRALRHKFVRDGHSVVSLALSGHGEEDEWNDVSYEKWQQDVTSVYLQLREDYEKVVSCGFSLGSVLSIALENSGNVKWDGGIYFSSPLFIRKWARYARTILTGRNFHFPTMIPLDIRAKHWSSSHSYKALFDAIDDAVAGNVTGNLFVGDPRDMMISWKDLRQRFPENQFLEVQSSHKAGHVTTMPEYLKSGNRHWEKIEEAIDGYLERL